MKRFLFGLALFGLALPGLAQDCSIAFRFTAAGNSAQLDNRQRGCVYWTVTYNSTGFTTLSLTAQTAPDSSGSPGAWSTFTATSGANPNTAITQNSSTFTGYFPWFRLNLAGLTGSGVINGMFYGFRNPPPGGSTISGNVSVVGPDAPGSPSTANPVQVAGNDGTDVRAIKTDTGGNSAVVGPVADGGSTVGVQPVMIGGQASGNLMRQFGLLDTLSDASATGGRSLAAGLSLFNGATWDRMRGSTAGAYVQGPVAAGSATSANPVMIGGVLENNTTVRQFSAYTNGVRHALAVAPSLNNAGGLQMLATSTDGGLRVATQGTVPVDGQSSTLLLQANAASGAGIQQSVFPSVFNGSTYDRQRGSLSAGTTVGGYGSGATGTLYGMTACDSSAVISVAAGTTVELVALIASRRVRVCSFTIDSDTAAATARFVYGTGATCGTGTTNLTGAYTLGVGQSISVGSGLGELFKTAAGNALCLTSVTGLISGHVSYAQF